MNVLIVEMENRPGELAKVAEALADRGINITGVGAAGSSGGKSAIAILTNDESGATTALERAGIGFRATPVVAATLEDRPGTLALAARRLADAGVNIEAVVPTGRSGSGITVGIGVDDAAKAEAALGELAGVAS
jgi:hypothetical protein